VLQKGTETGIHILPRGNGNEDDEVGVVTEHSS
jgi:hypothetical protein